MSTTHRGVDLSHHNDPVDLGAMKRAGVEFVALKATEGTGYTDPEFVDRRRRAEAVGFRHLLFYHFFRPDQDPQAQSLHFASVVGRLGPNEAVVIDVEEAPGWDALPEAKRADAIVAFVYRLKRALNLPASQVILYGSLGWLRGTFGRDLTHLTFMPLWVARYAPQLGDVTPWKDPLIWQTTDRGSVAGAGSVGVDLDVWMDAGAW